MGRRRRTPAGNGVTVDVSHSGCMASSAPRSAQSACEAYPSQNGPAPPKRKSFGAITKPGTSASPLTNPTPPSGISSFSIAFRAHFLIFRCGPIFFAPRVHLHLFCPLSQFSRAFPSGSLFLSQTCSGARRGCQTNSRYIHDRLCDWFQRNWYQLGSFLFNSVFCLWRSGSPTRFSRLFRASQQQVGALLKLSVPVSPPTQAESPYTHARQKRARIGWRPLHRSRHNRLSPRKTTPFISSRQAPASSAGSNRPWPSLTASPRSIASSAGCNLPPATDVCASRSSLFDRGTLHGECPGF